MGQLAWALTPVPLSLDEAYLTAPAIQTQTQGGRCGPVCLSNAVSAAAHALGLKLPYAPQPATEALAQKYLTRTGLTLSDAARATRELLQKIPQIEFYIEMFATENGSRGTFPFEELSEIKPEDLAPTRPGYDFGYTLLYARFIREGVHHGTHTFLFFGRDAQGHALLADPRAQQQVFRADFGEIEIEYPDGRLATIPTLRPLQASPVFKLVPRGIDPWITCGLRVSIRRRR